MKTMCKEEREYIVRMANTIWRIIAASGCIAMSWGISKIQPTIHEKMAALTFRVNGFKFQGKVYVTYNRGVDLFEIFLFDKKNNQVKHIEDVYVEDLVKFLDREIETEDDTTENYKKEVQNFLINF